MQFHKMKIPLLQLKAPPETICSLQLTRPMPLMPCSSRYQVVMMTNPGDMPLSYQILPPVDATKAEDAPSFPDLVDEAENKWIKPASFWVWIKWIKWCKWINT